MSDQNQNKKTYTQAASEFYNRQYENWVPWLEDQYLKRFTKDNKASYATKRMPWLLFDPFTLPHRNLHTGLPQCDRYWHVHAEELDKTKVTGVKQVDNLQDGVNNLAGGLVGPGGIAQPVGDLASKEGVNRAERGGKDEQGRPVEQQGPLGGYGNSAVEGVKGVGGGVTGGLKGVGGKLGGLWGKGGKE